MDGKIQGPSPQTGRPLHAGRRDLLPVDSLAGYLEDIKKIAARQGCFSCHTATWCIPERATVITAFSQMRENSSIYSQSGPGEKDTGCGLSSWRMSLRRGFVEYALHQAHLFFIRTEGPQEAKERTGSEGNMNPGKVYRAPFLLNPLFFHAGMAVLALMRRGLPERTVDYVQAEEIF